MIEILTEIDQKIFLFINSLAFPALDPVMLALSSHWFWVPVYFSLAAWFIWKYRIKGLIPLGLLFLTPLSRTRPPFISSRKSLKGSGHAMSRL